MLAADPRCDAPKGEVVVVVGPAVEAVASAAQADAALAEALSRAGPGEAAAEVARALGLSRRDLYARALALKGRMSVRHGARRTRSQGPAVGPARRDSAVQYG